jgi:hypothetical protein
LVVKSGGERGGNERPVVDRLPSAASALRTARDSPAAASYTGATKDPPEYLADGSAAVWANSKKQQQHRPSRLLLACSMLDAAAHWLPIRLRCSIKWIQSFGDGWIRNAFSSGKAPPVELRVQRADA